MSAYESICLPCRAHHHAECSVALAGDLPEGETCCCGGEFDLALAVATMNVQDTVATMAVAAELGMSALESKDGNANALMPGGVVVTQPLKGDHGYIHPDAWPSKENIGTLADPASTGRKRVAKMFPISGGMRCEWAGLRNCGGGPEPVLGCMNNPASDIHHGPDKNTLNNEKGTWQIGANENVHLICSECHNLWHAKNDPHYPEYDRKQQQAEPWLPIFDGYWGGHQPEPAELDELMEQERGRAEESIRTGKPRGRNGHARGTADTADHED